MLYQTPTAQIDTLESLQENMQYLRSNQSNALSESIKSTLNFQLQIIRNISTAKMVDSTFDLIFAEFKKSLAYQSDDYMREQQREKLPIYLNSYIFFLDAKLRYQFRKDEEDTEQLLEEAATMIAENSADVLLMASGAGASKVAVNLLAKQILLKAKEKPGLITRILRWRNKEKRQAQQTENFHQTLDFLFQKLHRHRKIIGASDITAGLINRWEKEVYSYRMSHSAKINNIGLSAGLLLTGLFAFFMYKNGFIDVQEIMARSIFGKATFLVMCISALMLVSFIFSRSFTSISNKIKLRNLQNSFYER